MKTIILIFALFLTACETSPTHTAKISENDPRPKEQMAFMTKMAVISRDYQYSSNVLIKDSIANEANTYLQKQALKIKNWVFEIDEIRKTNQMSNLFYLQFPNYQDDIISINLKSSLSMAEPDSSLVELKNKSGLFPYLPVSNQSTYEYQIPAHTKNPSILKILKSIKSLQHGNMVLVSGAITIMNINGEMDSKIMLDQPYLHSYDILIADIKLKP